MLFQISDTEVFIYGSVHLLAHDHQLPPRVFSVLSVAEDCIFESNLDNQPEPEFARYTNGDSIDRHISPELFAATKCLWESLNLPPFSPQLKPWWVGLLLGLNLIMRSGHSFKGGADRQLWDAAKRAGKRPFVLESNEALRAFDSAPLSEQISRLELIISEPGCVVRIFNQTLAAWRVADSVALAGELQVHLDLFPITYHSLIHDRNHQWLPQILGAIKRGRRAIFVVGAFHLVGDHSLQRLLQPHGYLALMV